MLDLLFTAPPTGFGKRNGKLLGQELGRNKYLLGWRAWHKDFLGR